MGDFIDSVGLVLSRVERRVETSAQNISNIATPGYNRAVSFENVLNAQGVRLDSDGIGNIANGLTDMQAAVDLSPGQPQNTGNPGDLAILGAGFFSVRTSEGALLYTRQGQFQRDDDGHLVNAQGAILQQAGGGDLVLKSGDFKVLGDGTVIQTGEAVGRIAIADISDPKVLRYAEDGLYAAPDDAVTVMDTPSISQGALEASNVSMGAEMLSIMAALREAQAGQRLVNVYDDLMGRAVTTFGQG